MRNIVNNSYLIIIKRSFTPGCLLFRWILLNCLVVIAAFTLALLRYLFERTPVFKIYISFQLLMVALFLTNFVYILGIVFESIYHRLWDKKINILEFEKRFFKAGLVMILLVNLFGVISYLVGVLGK